MSTRLSATERVKFFRMRGLVLLGVAVFIAILVSVSYFVSLPYAGYELSGSKIGAVAPNSPADSAGLRVGDELLSVNGLQFPSGKPSISPDQESLDIVVSREGQIIPLSIALAPPSLQTSAFHNSHFPIALLYWIIAMLVLFRKPRNLVSQLFVLICLLGTLGVVLWTFASFGNAWASMLVAVIVMTIAPAFAHYHTLFPEPVDFKGRRALLASLYGTGLTLLLLSTVSDFIYYLQLDLNGYTPPGLGMVMKVFFCFCLFLGIALLIRTFIVTKSEISRRRIVLVTISTAIAVIPLMTLIIIPQMFALPYVIPSWLVFLLLLFIPLGYLYGTYRHDLMELDPSTSRSVVTLTISLIVALLYLVIRWLIPEVFSGPVTPADVFLVGGFVLLYEPLRIGIERFIDSVLYGGWYEHDELVHRVSGALKDTLDSQTVTDLLVNDVADTMRFKEVALLLPEIGGDEDKDTFRVRKQKGLDAPMPIHRQSALAVFLLQVGEPIQHGVLCDQLRSDPAACEELGAWSEIGVQMWVPLVQQGTLMGVLVLGNKIADEFFTTEDHHTLGSIAHQAAITLARGQLVDQLQGRIQEIRAFARKVIAVEEDYKKRLAQELHDDVAHDLTFVLRLLEEPAETHSPNKILGARDVVQLTLDRLRDLMFELRPLNLGEDLEKALRDFAVSFQRRRKLPITFHANGNGISVPSEVRVAVFRICQESLNNAVKHAQARRIDVALDLQDDRARLVIQDNGVGFAVPDHFGSFIAQQRFGLVGMRERAEALGGTCEVRSKVKQGTQILVDIPFSAS